MEQDNSESWENTTILGLVGSLQMLLVKFSSIRNSVYWQKIQWKVFSKLHFY
jgi:hypothetical protein